MNLTDQPPTTKQLRYLRNLAMQRGESFAYPQTTAQASSEIERLKGRRRASYVERRIESEQISHEMAARGGAAAVREFEISGYGSSAHWKTGAS